MEKKNPNDLFETRLYNGENALRILLSKKLVEVPIEEEVNQGLPKPITGTMASRRKPDELLRRKGGVKKYFWNDVEEIDFRFGPTYGAYSIGRKDGGDAVHGTIDYHDLAGTGVVRINAWVWAGYDRPTGYNSSAVFGCNSDGDRAAGANNGTGEAPSAQYRRGFIFNPIDPPGAALVPPVPGQIGGSMQTGWYYDYDISYGPIIRTGREVGLDVNDLGVIVGHCYDFVLDGDTTCITALKWTDIHTVTNVMSPAGNSTAVGIDNNGTIIGQIGGSQTVPFMGQYEIEIPRALYGGTPYARLANGTMLEVDAETIVGSVTNPMVMKAIAPNTGNIIGWHESDGGFPTKSFFWDRVNDILYDIDPGDLPHIGTGGMANECNLRAMGVNDLNQVVGSYTIGYNIYGAPRRRAFIWDPVNGMRNLQTWKPSSIPSDPIFVPDDKGIVLMEGRDINNAQSVTATGYMDPQHYTYGGVWSSVNRLTGYDPFGLFVPEFRARAYHGRILG